jgi:excisionase family DNA binding protein
MVENDDDVIGTLEAAKRLGVSVRTIQLWVEKGMLRAWKTPGGHRRILRASVEAALGARAGEGADAGAPRILVVEDDLTMQSYYTALIEILRPDAEVRMAADGYEGLVELGRFAPRLMLVDVDMPGMDGITMLNRIASREADLGVRIAVVTGLTAEQVAARGGVPKDIPVYAKPISIDSLSALLEDVVTEDAR